MRCRSADLVSCKRMRPQDFKNLAAELKLQIVLGLHAKSDIWNDVIWAP